LQRFAVIAACVDIAPTGVAAVVYSGIQYNVKPKLVILDAEVFALHSTLFPDIKARILSIVAERNTAEYILILPKIFVKHAEEIDMAYQHVEPSFDPETTFISAANAISAGNVRIAAPTLAAGKISTALDVRVGEDMRGDPLRRAVLTLVSAAFGSEIQRVA
jgi:hypothetical protein